MIILNELIPSHQHEEEDPDTPTKVEDYGGATPQIKGYRRAIEDYRGAAEDNRGATLDTEGYGEAP